MADSPLAGYLRILREERGLKQEDVAKILGIKRAAYAHYENGINIPTAESLVQLAQFYGVSFNKLINVKEASRSLNNLVVTDTSVESSGIFLSYLEECSKLKKKDLPNWISTNDMELVYYFHNMSEHDKNILITMARMMASKD